MGGLVVYGESWNLPGVPETPNPFSPYLMKSNDRCTKQLERHHTTVQSPALYSHVEPKVLGKVKPEPKTVAPVDPNKT